MFIQKNICNLDFKSMEVRLKLIFKKSDSDLFLDAFYTETKAEATFITSSRI